MRAYLADVWQRFVRPTGIHPWRWRGLLAWILVFTPATALALHENRNEARRTSDRFCEITRTFIASNQTLRNATNQASVQTIGARQALIANDQALISALAPALDSSQTSASGKQFVRLFITYLSSEVALNDQLNNAGQGGLNAADIALDEWARLKRALRC